MAEYKVGIVGYFAKGKSKAGGQEAKTCAIDVAIKEKYGVDSVMNVDTTDWKKKPLSLLTGLVLMVFKCENIIMLPAQNSLKVFLPIVLCINKFLHRKLFYSVVGGWLPDVLKKNKNLLSKCNKLDCIFVETKSMRTALHGLGLDNVEVVPNFKNLTPLKLDEVITVFEKPYKLCTFSRVMKEKGIEDVVNAIISINSEMNETVFRLDIYGKVDDGYVSEFNELQKKFPSYIRYAGMVEPNESIDTIRGYYALVFATHYFTEGVPGTLIDACMAGVPVISALWGNYDDVFVHGVTGWGYEFDNQKELIRTLKLACDKKDEFVKMRHLTLSESEKYLPPKNIEIITSFFS